MIVRLAHDDDIAALTRVHVESWRATYRGIVPEDFLNELSFESQEARNRDTLKKPGAAFYVAELPSRGIIGYISGGPERNADPQFKGGLYAIYILHEHRGRGIGTALVRQWATHLRSAGLSPAMVWVFQQNQRAIEFYQRMGAAFVRQETIEIGGKPLMVSAFGWKDLNAIPFEDRYSNLEP